MHHLARCHGDVLAEREGAGIGVGQLPSPQIVEQVLHALDQIVAAAFQRALHDDGIEQREIRRACSFGDGLGGKAQLLALVLAQSLHLIDHVADALGEEQVSLMDQRKGGMRAPPGIGEAAILQRHLGIVGRNTGHLAQTVLPQHLLPQLHAFLHQLLLLRRIGDRHLAEPVLSDALPAGGIEIGGHGLRIGELFCLILHPHGLQLRADLGPVLRVFRLHRRIAHHAARHRALERGEHHPRQLGRGFVHVGEGIGAGLGHCRS